MNGLTNVLFGDEEIKITKSGRVVAHFEGIGNGIDGEIHDGDGQHRLDREDLIYLAEWLLQKARETKEDCIECGASQ